MAERGAESGQRQDEGNTVGLSMPYDKPERQQTYYPDGVKTLIEPEIWVRGPAPIRHFDSGATRNVDTSKFDYEAFLNPEALHAYAAFMHEHRLQRDGSVREGDNWQKGIPFAAYAKSLVRHSIDLWRMHRGYKVTNPDTGQLHTKQELCCSILFNSFGYLKELLDPTEINKGEV